jgi:serine/threonine-protein kinase
VTHPATVGRYRLLAPLGQGAMGVVYRAHDPQLERDVAVKLISVRFAAGHGDPKETSTRFAREARVAARLHHPNVVTVFDAGEVDEQLYLVMELVEGETLGHRLARGDFPGTGEALEIVAQTADALAAAHQAGVIHRDMKPGNLLITKRGQVKVADFGIARAMGESTELTRTGMMVGSPAYMAPEQVMGKNLDGRADLFSLGVVLYEMLLRRKPFPADTLTTLVYQILHEDPFDSETVTEQLQPQLAEFLKWTMAKEPAHRVPDAATFAARARTLAAGLAGSGTAPTSRMPLAAAAGAAAIPGPSYATSAPTAIVERAGSGNALRWILFAAAGLLFLAVGAVLVLKRPAPPPDSSGGAAPRVAAEAQPLRVEAPAVPEPKPEEPKPEEPKPEPKPTPKPVPATAKPEVPAALPVTAEAPAPPPAETLAPPPPVEAPPISATFEGRSAAEFHVDPEEALVTIDGNPIGPADDWDGAGGGKEYTFPGPGDYVAKFTLDGYRTAWVRVRITPSARRAIADVEFDLEELD